MPRLITEMPAEPPVVVFEECRVTIRYKRLPNDQELAEGDNCACAVCVSRRESEASA